MIIIILLLYLLFVICFNFYAHQHKAGRLGNELNLVFTDKDETSQGKNNSREMCCGMRLLCLSVYGRKAFGTGVLSP